MTNSDMEQKAYSEYTGQGSDDDMGPRSVLPPKTKVVGITARPHRTRVPDPEGDSKPEKPSPSARDLSG